MFYCHSAMTSTMIFIRTHTHIVIFIYLHLLCLLSQACTKQTSFENILFYFLFFVFPLATNVVTCTHTCIYIYIYANHATENTPRSKNSAAQRPCAAAFCRYTLYALNYLYNSTIRKNQRDTFQVDCSKHLLIVFNTIMRVNNNNKFGLLKISLKIYQ